MLLPRDTVLIVVAPRFVDRALKIISPQPRSGPCCNRQFVPLLFPSEVPKGYRIWPTLPARADKRPRRTTEDHDKANTDATNAINTINFKVTNIPKTSINLTTSTSASTNANVTKY